MQVLIIGDDEAAQIEEALRRARAEPVSLDWCKDHAVDANLTAIDFETAQRALKGESTRSQCVTIPHGFHACISFEQQPLGLMRHLSISYGEDDQVPSPRSVATLAIAFGFSFFPPKIGTLWIEEFRPGRRAINVLELAEPGYVSNASERPQ
jgi:hypothetical protein